MKRTKKAQVGSWLSKYAPEAANLISSMSRKKQAKDFAENQISRKIGSQASKVKKIGTSNPNRSTDAYTNPKLTDIFSRIKDDYNSMMNEKNIGAGNRNVRAAGEVKRQIKKQNYKTGGTAKAKTGKLIPKKSSVSKKLGSAKKTIGNMRFTKKKK